MTLRSTGTRRIRKMMMKVCPQDDLRQRIFSLLVYHAHQHGVRGDSAGAAGRGTRR